MFSGKLFEDHLASNRLGFVTARFPSSMASFYSLMLVTLLLTGLTPLRCASIPPVSTIHSPDGDTIDCINREDQPAFRHPHLRDHKIQEFPTGMSRIEEKARKRWQMWHETGEDCPAGTIPMLRPKGNSTLYHKKYPPRPIDLGRIATSGHMYGIASIKVNQSRVYGTKATLNVWDPVVEMPGDFSLAQIWVASGSYETADLNTIEAGWQVFPSKYYDNQPRLFTYWTANSYQQSGCYGLECPGFVQTSRTIAIGAAFSPTSTFGGNQRVIIIQIWKDPFSGNWWLALGENVVPVGYWPASLFTVLSDHAARVDWGGEVLYNNLSGINTIVQMGSGKFAKEGWRKAAYFCNLEIAENNNTFLPVRDFKVGATNPDYYTVKKYHNKECGDHFYYGGPGPLSSEAVRASVVSGFVFLWLCVLFSCF